MRCKTLVDPSTQFEVSKGDQWISPDGHSPHWRRIWNGTAWGENLDEEGKTVDETDEPLDERDDMEEEISEDSTEGDESEQSVQTEISDSDGGEQGASGKPEPEPQQRGKRGKVRKGGKG